MSNFSDLLKYYIQKKKINVSALSKVCVYDRSTVHKFIAGTRNPPSLSMVQEIGRFLSLTPNETSDFLVAYYQALLGEKIYEEFQSTLNFVLGFKSSEISANSLGQIRYEFNSENQRESMALNNTAELTKAFYHILFKSMEGNKKVTLILQPGNTPMNEFFISILTSLDLDVTHVLCLSNNETLTDSVHYNISGLKQTLSFFSHLNHYKVFYYYDNAQTRFDNYTLFPFLILTEDGTVAFDAKFNKGIYHTSTDVVALYQKQVETLLSVCLPLYKTTHGILEECMIFNGLTDHFSVLECQPCILSFISKELINKAILEDLPNRETLIHLLNQYLRLQEHNFIHKKAYSYFTPGGLDYFVETGRVPLVPDGIYRPLTIKERIEILTKTLPSVENGLYRMVKKELKNIDLHLHLSLHNETTAALYVKDSKGQMVIAILEEPRLFSIFKDFFKHLEKYDYIESIEETLSAFNHALFKLKEIK